MAIGVIVKQREGEKGAEKDTIIEEIPELLAKKGTNNQAEYLAIIKGLSFVQEKYRSEGGIPNLDMIVVLSDSELAINQIEGKYKTKDSHLEGLCNQDKIAIPLTIFRRPEWSELTLAEAMVTELLENRKLTLKQVAEELGRNYHTIRTQYLRAKKKLLTRKDGK
jgi:ribonuclease HI